jgi:hypothetical protein
MMGAGGEGGEGGPEPSRREGAMMMMMMMSVAATLSPSPHPCLPFPDDLSLRSQSSAVFGTVAAKGAGTAEKAGEREGCAIGGGQTEAGGWGRHRFGRLVAGL